MTEVSCLQAASAIVLNAGFALVLGAWCARWWLRGDGVVGVELQGRLRRVELVSALVALGAAALSLWAASAVMTGEPLVAALRMLPTMAWHTAYGQAGLAGMVMLVAIAALAAFRARQAMADIAVAVLLLAFAASRASVSHAGEDGLLTLAFRVEWLHLVAIALWFGGVAIAAWWVVPSTSGASGPSPVGRYLATLSHTATLALVVILATGLYNAWQRVGNVGNLGTTYGEILVEKLVAVGLAMALGGYNKVWGFPALARSNDEAARVTAILQVESVLLLGALIAAGFLTGQQPPTAV